MSQQFVTNEELSQALGDIEKKLDKFSGLWWKIGGIVLIPFLLTVFGYGKLNADVDHLQIDLSSKANRETVEVQLNAMNETLISINNKLDRLTTLKTTTTK